MKISAVALGVGAMLAASPALARDYVLLDAGKAPANQTITSKSLGVKSATPFTVTTKTLHGGRQEGVMLVEIDTGAMKITVVPTRGMNVLQAVAGDVRLGWHSPVKEVVNPSFIELTGRNGLGWLEGFNELVTRCGYEWVGHPGKDTDGTLLTLHGLAANIPASKVVLSVDEKPPYTIRLKGLLREQAFKKVDYVIETELNTVPGATAFTVHDKLTNQGDYPKEYQALYHSNFGAPLLERTRSSLRRCVRFRPSTTTPGRIWPPGRPIAAPPAAMTRLSTTSSRMAMRMATRWPCCTTPPASWA